MTKLKTIIVDDEAKARRILAELLKDYCPEVELVDTAEDVLSGVKAIQSHKPDLVFLDIEMPNYSGFKLVEYFDDVDFDIVFTTAYEQYAIKAFKVRAQGYLLKPVDIDDLTAVVQKVLQQRNEEVNTNDSSPEEEPSNTGGRMQFPAPNGIVYLKDEEIYYIESEGRYSNIYDKDGAKLVTTKPLKDLESMLSTSSFIRVHRSYIINLAYIKHYARGRDSHVILENDQRVDVGKHYKDDLNKAVSLFLK